MKNNSLFSCLIQGKQNDVKSLVIAGADISMINKIGETPLIIASRYATLSDLVKLFIDMAPSNINQQDNCGVTALINAVRFGAIENVNYLLNANADPLIENNKGQTAMTIAYRMKYFKLLASLEKHCLMCDIIY